MPSRVLAGRRRVLGAEHPDTLSTLTSLGQLRLQERKYTEAEATLRETLTAYEKARPDMWERYGCQSLLGASLASQKKFAEAEPMLVTGYEGMAQRAATMAAADRSNLKDAGERIVELYRDWGKPEKVAEWQRRLEGANLAGAPQRP